MGQTMRNALISEQYEVLNLRRNCLMKMIKPFTASLYGTMLVAASMMLDEPTSQGQASNMVLDLNGAGYASISSSSLIQDPEHLTIEMWAFIKDNPAFPNEFLLGKGDGGSVFSQQTYQLVASEEGKILFIIFPTTPTWAQAGADIIRNQWIHIAGTFDSEKGEICLYLNGDLVTCNTIDASGKQSLNGMQLRQTTLPLNLGALTATRSFAAGQLDEVRIWNVTRTAQEIRTDRHCTLTGQEPGLAAYWTFDSGSVEDRTGNGHHGSLLPGAQILDLEGPDVIHSGCPPIISDFFVDPNGIFNLRLQLRQNQKVRISSTIDFEHWFPVVSVDLEQDDGSIVVGDPMEGSKRFYRAVAFPSEQ